MRLSGFGWVNSKKSLLRLCLCLVLVGVITAGAVAFTAMSSTGEKLPTVQMCQAAPLQQNEAGYAPSAIAGNKPSIDVFKATPMVLDTPSSAAVYTFKVKNATNVQINEAGANIKTISNPSGAALQGTATGLPASAIATDDSGKFITVLTASNDNGSDQAELTLSLSEKLLASRLPAGQSEETGNQNSKYKPTWGPLIYHPVTPNPTTTTTLNEPKFFECPSDCDHCLRPDEAASQGFGQRCSEERCYYSPDNQQNWYCYKPTPGWCCANGNVFQSIKGECNKMGGFWSTSQAEALQACQPKGFCCVNGQVYYPYTESQCAQMGGSYWSTNQAQVMERCQPETCWCCLPYGGTSTYVVGGTVRQMPAAQCIQQGGTCYATEAQAIEHCRQSPTCWCCAYGKVYQSTQAQCAQSGGTCYSSYEQAQQYCRQSTPQLK
jgi:hypothetical protein